jgi:hypothetical protein
LLYKLRKLCCTEAAAAGAQQSPFRGLRGQILQSRPTLF